MGDIPVYNGIEYDPFSNISEDGKCSSGNDYCSANNGFVSDSTAFGMENAF